MSSECDCCEACNCPGRCFRLCEAKLYPANIAKPQKVKRYLDKGGDPARIYHFTEGDSLLECLLATSPMACCSPLVYISMSTMQFAHPVQRNVRVSLGANVTPVHVAAYLKAEESIRLLLKAGGPDLLKIQTTKGATPLDIAIEVNCKPSIISLLQGDLTAPIAEAAMMRAPHTACNVIMISYQWDSQPIALKLRDSLERHGKKVIIDTGGISGNFLEWMNESVEKCDAMVVVLTEKYQNSKNCEKEACRAHELKKRIIPVVAQESFTATGWLSMVIAGLLRYDIHNDHLFEANMERILEREI
jgi:hypothetical protein